MVQLTDDAFEAATLRGEERVQTDPRAVAARFDAETGRVVVDLANGCTYLFPAEMAQELSGADPTDLAEIEIDGAGFNLHWPRLDADLYVPATVAGVFGTKAWMAKQWASAAGGTSSPAKAAAARANGAKGGRPKKQVG
jgi:hypothetical protein